MCFFLAHRQFYLFRPRVFSRALGSGARRQLAQTPRRKCGPWPRSVARALGINGRENWRVTTGGHSERLEPSRPMQTHVQVKKMSDGLRMLFRIQLTSRAVCRATSSSCSSAPLAVLLARGTAHTACFRLSGCTRSSLLLFR